MTEFSRIAKLIDIPDGESQRAISANDTECAAIAHRLGLEAVTAVSADVRLLRLQGSPLVHVEGTLNAEIQQISVVTMEPFDSKLTEAFDACFTTARAAKDEKLEVVIDAAGEDEPEPVVAGRIDLGEVVIQHLSLALDPHPRRAGEGTEMQSFGATEEDTHIDKEGPSDGSNPFAVLEGWKQRP